jgi:hypothetical protein
MRSGKVGRKWFGRHRHEDDSNHLRHKKSRRISNLSQKATVQPVACGRQVSRGIRQSMPDNR